jgi:hypothetical protein
MSRALADNAARISSREDGMAVGRKSKAGAGNESNDGKGGLHAQPDGSVRWTKGMRESLARFNDRACGHCGGLLCAERSLGDSLEFYRRHHAQLPGSPAPRGCACSRCMAPRDELFFDPSPA